MTRPRKRRTQAPVSHHRPGEIALASGFLNRSVAAWYKQMRRVQSYLHAVKSTRSEDNYVSPAQLWNAILSATGFEAGFQTWWLRGHVSTLTLLVDLPVLPPSQEIAQQIYEDFFQNFRKYGGILLSVVAPVLLSCL